MLVALPAQAGLAAPTDGYVRLAHLSPDTPAVDVYLYSAGKTTPRLVLRHVGYGALSPYQRLGNGAYTVAMRPASAKASSPPVLSTNLEVAAGSAYTVAGMGPYKSIKLQVLDDSPTVGAGQAALRVVEASLKEATVDVTVDGSSFAKALSFANVTPYQSMAARTSSVAVTSPSGKTATSRVRLAPGSIHTIVVLDGRSGLRLLDVTDATQGGRTPRGGVNTGLGGLGSTGIPWPAALAGLVVVALTVLWAVRLRRRA